MAEQSAIDQERSAAIAERERNVVIDAGAGTGKTSVLVRRVTHLVSDEQPVPLARIAAITFTRRAAGELKIRIREELLKQLAKEGTGERRARLRAALADIDSAHIGTIHGFADRLLRRYPMETKLSPDYEIVEDESLLVAETTELLLDAAQRGRLTYELPGVDAAEAEETIQFAIRAGIHPRSLEHAHGEYAGLDALVRDMVRQRDVDVTLPALRPFDRDGFEASARRFIEMCRGVSRATLGGEYLWRVKRALEEALRKRDPAAAYSRVRRELGRRPTYQLGRDFKGDKAAWAVFKTFRDGDKPDTPLRRQLLDFFSSWLATRLARLRPVILAFYKKVKTRRQVVDQLDLLLRLRDLLREDKQARAECQALFDHVLVDEFQDTDPLQAEIVLFLCQDGTTAQQLEDIRVAPGKLTIVGDPKQSIYRFRRADIEVYDRVRSIVLDSGALEVELKHNFRSSPGLIQWFNDRLGDVLGRGGPDDAEFDATTGTVHYRELLHPKGGKAEKCVDVLPFEVAASSTTRADDYRRAEAEALARYLRWLVDRSGREVRDPLTGAMRPVGFGDIAVLAVTTTHLGLLFDQLDELGVPYSSRGGTLFLQDSLHKQLLLGLRAIANGDDGPAQAAVFRPPFFAIDPHDVAAKTDAGLEARELVSELRRDRFKRSPGQTARDLIERTGFARTVAVGPNGAQRLSRLRELCLAVDRIAHEEQLDFDGVTTLLRELVEHPAQMDPPRPVGSNAVEIGTVHQAKGLEYPVVVLWDGQQQLASFGRSPAWRAVRDGSGWTLALDGCAWEQPPGLGLAKSEKTYSDAEQRRVVYVAATRARDRLVLPLAGKVSASYVAGVLIGDPEHSLAERLDLYREGVGATWSRELVVPDPERGVHPAPEAGTIETRYREALHMAAKPRFVPVAVSTEGHAQAAIVRDEDDDTEPRPRRIGRHGPIFGDTVHGALARLVEGRAASAKEAVETSALEHELEQARVADAVQDVERAVACLRQHNLWPTDGVTVRVEYPVAGPIEDGKLLSGYIDLVAVREDGLHVIDFKTDAPPTGDVGKSHPEYVAQVQLYARLLRQSPELAAMAVHGALLFTGDGGMRSVDL